MGGTAEARLAVYGSLAPGRANHRELAGLAGAWRPGRIRGHLFEIDQGAARGYLGLILDPEGPELAVQLFESDELPAHWSRLDAFEGEDYRRATTSVATDDGEVQAFVYVLAPDGGSRGGR